MLTVIFAGLGMRHYGAYKGYVPIVNGWQIDLIPSRKNSNDFTSCMSEVETALEKRASNAQGTHILAFHSKRSEHEALREKLGYCVRFIWLDEDYAQRFGSQAFDQYLVGVLETEAVWRERIRPSDLHSPLLLPQGQFIVEEEAYREIWPRADRAKEIREIERTSDLIERFQSKKYVHHRTDRYDARAYLSDDELAFMFPRPQWYHGRAAWRRRQKFTFLFPDGFHYDVEHQNQRAFEVTGADGMPIAVPTYVNISPYGDIRKSRRR